jgi:hypothetical protein
MPSGTIVGLGGGAIMTRSAAALLAATLDKHGVDLIYCVPGESYLAVTDALIVVDVRASLNHFTAWRRLDEMPAYKAAQ